MAAVDAERPNVASSIRMDATSKIEENIQVVDDKSDEQAAAERDELQDAKSQGEDPIQEQLEIEDQSCEFGQFKHQLCGS